MILNLASLAVALVVLNAPVEKVFAQGTNQTFEQKGGLEALLKGAMTTRAHMPATTGETAGTHRIVIGLIGCPANFTNIETQCDVFLLH
jgi:hypothetical protein